MLLGYDNMRIYDVACKLKFRLRVLIACFCCDPALKADSPGSSGSHKGMSSLNLNLSLQACLFNPHTTGAGIKRQSRGRRQRAYMGPYMALQQVGSAVWCIINQIYIQAVDNPNLPPSFFRKFQQEEAIEA